MIVTVTTGRQGTAVRYVITMVVAIVMIVTRGKSEEELYVL